MSQIRRCGLQKNGSFLTEHLGHGLFGAEPRWSLLNHAGDSLSVRDIQCIRRCSTIAGV